MKSRLLWYCLFISPFYITVISQVDWLEYEWREQNYQSDLYYTAFSEDDYEKNEYTKDVIDELKKSVLSQLSSTILVKVKSTALSTIEKVDGVYESQMTISSSASTDIELVDVKPQIFLDEKNRKVYAFAYINKNSIYDFYNDKLRLKLPVLEKRIEQGELYLENKNQTLSRDSYNEAQCLLLECQADYSIVRATQIVLDNNHYGERLIRAQSNLMQLIQSLKTGKNRSISDLSNIVSQEISRQLKEDCDIKVGCLTYADTDFMSSFSKYFYKNLVSSFALTNNISTVDKVRDNDLLLKGSYWEEGDQIVVSIFVSTLNGEIKAAISDVIDKHYLDNAGIEYRAENFAEAYSRLKILSENEIVSGDLRAEVWTNKGDENLLFEEGDIMKLFVRVNQPAYLRIVYYFADASKILLLDNYYIDQSMVNKVVTIPDEFVCSAPFGYETLQLNAQTRSFNDLKTNKQFGYDFIMMKNEDVVSNTRGFKKITGVDRCAEVRLNITTCK